MYDVSETERVAQDSDYKTIELTTVIRGKLPVVIG